MDAWSRELGTEQGRIPNGQAFLFCLGIDEAARFDRFSIGEYAQISQVATFTAGTRVLNVNVQTRSPELPTLNAIWKLQLLVDGIVRAYQFLAPGEPTRSRVLSANVAQLSGSRTITIRLQLVPITGAALASLAASGAGTVV